MTDPSPQTAIFLHPIRPADRDWLVEAHATLYAREAGFDGSFGALVADILDQYFATARPGVDQGWIAWRGTRRLGSVFCVDSGTPGLARLRLFLLLPEARGTGLGRRMLRQCTRFARGAGYGGMTLSTHESHRAACALYASEGWRLVDAKPLHSFGCALVEQRWDRPFS